MAGGVGFCGVGLRPATLGLRPVGALDGLLVHIRCFLDPTNPASSPTRASIGQQDTQGGRRKATHEQQQPSEAPQRLDRAVTLAPTLGTGAVHGDSSTYTDGKSRPT